MRSLFTRSAAALAALCLLAPSTALARTTVAATSGLSGGQLTAQGFDKCNAPPSSAMRSWLGSPYRAVNIYFGGNNRACASQPELTAQWLTTVTSNGWSVIPTYVGSQARCSTSTKTNKITASTAAEQGTAEADDAATQMAALGMPAFANNPVYFDMEPYHVGSSYRTCDNAVLTFFDAWTRELHLKGYVSGIYGTTNTVMKQLVTRRDDPTFQQPDAIWFANWDGNPATTGYSAIPDDLWVGHRIHQFRGGHNEKFNGITFNIDNDAIDGDVVTAVTPTPPQGPPYHYAAAPPAGSTLKERSTPETTPDNKTGITYPTGADLSIVCQTVGENIDGSVVWNQLSDGAFVADLFTTTTGGLTFTAGLPRCDTTSPTATMGPLKPATKSSHRTIRWSGTDDASGVTLYDVRYRSASWNSDLGSFHRLLTHTADTSTSVPLTRGTRYCFEVRAVDGSGNVGDWTSDSCVARALDDRSLGASAAWRRITGGRYYANTATATHAAAVRLKLPDAHVSLVGVVATTGPKAGSVDIYVKKRLMGTLSLRSPSHAERRILLLPAFPARVGALRVRTTDEDALVRIDGLIVGQ
jgi:hypothetical protein